VSDWRFAARKKPAARGALVGATGCSFSSLYRNALWRLDRLLLDRAFWGGGPHGGRRPPKNVCAEIPFAYASRPSKVGGVSIGTPPWFETFEMDIRRSSESTLVGWVLSSFRSRLFEDKSMEGGEGAERRASLAKRILSRQ
jgi:hypothetical protein